MWQARAVPGNLAARRRVAGLDTQNPAVCGPKVLLGLRLTEQADDWAQGGLHDHELPVDIVQPAAFIVLQTSTFIATPKKSLSCAHDSQTTK